MSFKMFSLLSRIFCKFQGKLYVFLHQKVRPGHSFNWTKWKIKFNIVNLRTIGHC